MAFHRRSAWTTTSKTAVKVKRTQTEVYIHWPAHGGVIGRDRGRIKELLRAWWRQHKIAQGWSDIAYNLGVDQNGDIWELRGIDRQCGGNGGTTTNRRGQAILAIMGTGESPSQDMIRGIREAVGMIRAEHPSCRKILGHRDSFEASTSCPGSKLYALVRSGAFEPTAQTVAKQADKAAPSSDGLSGGFADVDKAQAWLISLGYDPGPTDGKYGAKTQAATRAFQTDFGITPADGRPGPATRTILEDAVTKLDDIDKKLDALPKLVWGIGGGPHAPMIGRRLEKGAEYPETTLGSMTDRIVRQHIVPLRGEVAGLGKAIEQIGKGEPVDLDAVRAAAQQGVADALGEVTADVRVTVKGD